MKVSELLYLVNKHLKSSIIKFPQSSKYIIYAYSNIIKKIKNVKKLSDKFNKSDIEKLDITPHMKNKLNYLILQKISESELKKLKQNTKQKSLVNNLMEFAGIGKSKAESLIKTGLTKISDLNKKKYSDQLNDATKLLMKYKPDKCIQYSCIKKIEKDLTGFPNTQIVGGFRRKKSHSKDIDVMLVSNSASIDRYLGYLSKKFKEIHVYSHGNDKASLIININDVKINKCESNKHPNSYYKIDVFRVPTKYRHAMLLYSTGSKEFNIRMRAIASKLGYLLNQNGLYKKNNSIPIKVSSEKDFFTILGMKYVEPENR
jgi:DNA polymerase/3'-5' exonuclease PolX